MWQTHRNGVFDCKNSLLSYLHYGEMINFVLTWCKSVIGDITSRCVQRNLLHDISLGSRANYHDP